MMEITPFDGDDVGGESASFPPSLSLSIFFPLQRKKERNRDRRKKKCLN